MAYLERAVAEPPAPELLGQALFELGMAEAEMSAPAASEHLRAAYERLDDPAARATAAFVIAQAELFIGKAPQALELTRRTAAELPPELEDERQALESVELLASFFGAVSDAPPVERPRTGTPGANLLAAVVACAMARAGRPARECEELAIEALTSGPPIAGSHGMFWSAALVALYLADSPRFPEFAEKAREDSYRHGSVFLASSAEMWGGIHLLRAGELDGAVEGLRISAQLQVPWGSDPTGTSWSRGLLALCEFVRGDSAAARAAMGEPPAPDERSDGALFLRRASAELLLADGRADEALAEAESMAAMGVLHPDWNTWQSLRARAMSLLGRDEEALEEMAAELERARATEATSTIGRCLRQLGELEREAGVERLREAVELLSGASARLEYARALGALGASLRRYGQRVESREPLREALELASACGCEPLVEQVRSELHAAGSRPRITALGGVESLTARETRVAGLVAEGRTNRDVAQALFVTPKTVEVHLSNVYRKLGIRSRRELAGALQAT